MKTSERGTTIVEILLYLVLAALFLTVIGHIFSFSLKCWVEGSRQAEAQESARMALDSMVRELRQAANIEYSANKPGEITYIDPANNKKVRFYEYSGVLYRDSDIIPQPVAGAGKLRVKNVEFTVTPDLQIVDIALTVTWHDWNGSEENQTLKTTVYLSNTRPQQ